MNATQYRMSEAMQQIVEACPSCGQLINVTEQEPFTKVSCPTCGATMRARLHFNNFTLLELLGEGGMGSVFKAIDNNLQRKVALKILKRSAGSTKEDWSKLAIEARLTAAINHPNVVKVYSFGEDHGQFYLAMELVEKGSLDNLMTLQTRVAEIQVLDIGIQIAEGLQAALEGGLIHRDIKPGNILFAGPRLAKIVDFGLARVLSNEAQEAGEIWGTPFYVAPEKLDGRPEDFRSDMYSLGGTLFHALAGRPPFDAKTASIVVLKHIKSQVVSLQAFAPHISDETAYVINRMMSKEPENRYSSYEELIAHLYYARQQLQKRSAEQGGATVRKVVKSGSNRIFFGTLWGGAIASWLVVMAYFLVLREPLPKMKAPPNSAASLQAAQLIMEGREALIALRLTEAQAKFARVVEATDRQPEKNWALAQLGLTSLLSGNMTETSDIFAKLQEHALFDIALVPQALGRFFRDLARCVNDKNFTPVYSVSNYEAFGILVYGLKTWNMGDIELGNTLLEKFSQSHPSTPNGWISHLKPLAEPYLADYQRYIELQEAAKNATGDSVTDLLVRIEKARCDAKTGRIIAQKFDALVQSLELH